MFCNLPSCDHPPQKEMYFACSEPFTKLKSLCYIESTLNKSLNHCFDDEANVVNFNLILYTCVLELFKNTCLEL